MRLGAILLWLLIPSVLADSAEDYSLAVGFYKRQRWVLAEKAFAKFLDEFPEDQRASNAQLYLGLTRINLAAGESEKIRSGDEATAEEARKLQTSYYTQARKVLRELAINSPNNKNISIILYRIGECSYLLGDSKSAAKELKTFVDQFPDDGLCERALPYLGEVQLQTKDAASAVLTYQTAIEKFPKGIFIEDCHFDLARAYEATRDTAKAVELYEKIASEPQGAHAADALLQLGALYFEARNYSKAADVYARLEQNFANSPQVTTAVLNQAKALYLNGEFEKAIPKFDQAAQKKEVASEAKYWKALAHKAQGKQQEAIGIFDQELKDRPESAYAERIRYQWGDSENRLGNRQSARTILLEVITKHPNGDWADDALHLATLISLELKEFDETEKLLTRFGDTFPMSPLKWQHKLLQGRLALEKQNPQEAVTEFEEILKSSKDKAAEGWARFYLAHAYRSTDQNKLVLSVSEPLLPEIKRDPAKSQFASLLLVRAEAYIGLAKLAAEDVKKKELGDSAIATLDEYLTVKRSEIDETAALSLKAVAKSLAGTVELTEEDLQKLIDSTSDPDVVDQAILSVAETVYEKNEFDRAEKMFKRLVDRPQDAKLRPQGLSGLGWSLFKQKKYKEAIETFKNFVDSYPNHARALESNFMRAQSLEEDMQLDQALVVYTECFNTSSDAKFAYLSGLQAARLQREQQKIDEADALYGQVYEKYKSLPDEEKQKYKSLMEGDKLLDEWALMNYTTQRFGRSDEIFQMLLTDFPESDRAHNARLSLAESTLVSGNKADAEKEFRAILDAEKADSVVKLTALRQLVGIAQGAEKWEEVKTLCKEYAPLYGQKEKWRFEFWRANAELRNGEPKLAIARISEVLNARTDAQLKSAEWYPEAWFLQAEAQFQEKDYDALKATLDDFRNTFPNSDRGYLADELLGRSLKAQAMFTEAREAFRRVIKDKNGKRTETAAKSQFLIAETFFLEKKYQTAEEEYLMVEIQYRYPEWQAMALFQAAGCQEHLNKWKEAVKSYESLIKQFPESEYAKKGQDLLEVARKKSTQ